MNVAKARIATLNLWARQHPQLYRNAVAAVRKQRVRSFSGFGDAEAGSTTSGDDAEAGSTTTSTDSAVSDFDAIASTLAGAVAAVKGTTAATTVKKQAAAANSGSLLTSLTSNLPLLGGIIGLIVLAVMMGKPKKT